MFSLSPMGSTMSQRTNDALATWKRQTQCLSGRARVDYNMAQGTSIHQIEAMTAKARSLQWELANKKLSDAQRASKARILAALAFEIETKALLAHEASTRYHESAPRGTNGLPVASNPELKLIPGKIAPSYNVKPKKIWART